MIDRPDTFEKIVLGMNGVRPRIDVLEEVSPVMISKAVKIILKMSKEERFSEDVWKYIANSLVRDGHVLLPKWLVPARKYMVKLEKREDVRPQLEKMVLERRSPRTSMEKVALERLQMLIGA